MMASNLRTLANLSKSRLKEEEYVHQFNKEMEPMSQEGEPTRFGGSC
jgi:hypothetical protein